MSSTTTPSAPIGVALQTHSLTTSMVKVLRLLERLTNAEREQVVRTLSRLYLEEGE